MEVVPCPLGILALRLCLSMAASKSFGHLGGDFSQLADERIKLFAPFAVPAETEPDDRWKRPQRCCARVSFLRAGSPPLTPLMEATSDMLRTFQPYLAAFRSTFGRIGLLTEGTPPVPPSPADPLVGPYTPCGIWMSYLWF